MTPSRPFSLALLVAALALTTGTPALAKKKPPRGCPGGRFLVTKGQDLLGPEAALVLDGTSLAVEGACPATGSVKQQRRGTHLAAAWDACGSATKLRLRARATDCSTIRGKIRARGRRASFVALASTCGDGVLDPGAGEQCDGAVACGGGATCSATCRCSPPPLDCARDGYPCRFSDVPLAVVERSLALSEQIAGLFAGGQTVDQAGAFLESQPDMADVIVDGGVIAFRVTGGRPMLVDYHGEQQMLPATPAAAKTLAAGVAAASASPAFVVGEGPQKRGLVLSPFRYEPMFGVGDVVTEALRGVRGYEQGVTYHATLDEMAPQVTVDLLTQLDGWDVIHIDTHGGSICKKRMAVADANLPDKPKCDGGITDFLVQRFHGTAADLKSIAHPGVVHYRGRLHESIAVTPDFFRHYYPNGLANTVFVLQSCNTFRPDMADAIAGEEGVYVSWDGFVDHTMAHDGGLALMDLLGQGLAVRKAFGQLPPLTPTHPAAAGSRLRHTLRRAGGDLRIRELLRLLDPAGQTLVPGTKIPIVGEPEDGQPDQIQLLLEVDGIPEDEEFRVIKVTVGGETVAVGAIQGFAAPTGPWRWLGEPVIDLGFDAADGQQIDLVVSVTLPDGGFSEFAVPVVLDAPGFHAGRVWEGTFTYWDAGLTVRTMTVTARFERDPDDGPTDTHPTFRLVSGTLSWSLADAPGDCIYSAPPATYPIGPDEDSFFMIDLTKQPVIYYGRGHVQGPYVDLVRNCPTVGDATSSTQAGGTWFNAPLDEGFVAGSDSTLKGEFSFNFGDPSLWTWSLEKVE